MIRTGSCASALMRLMVDDGTAAREEVTPVPAASAAGTCALQVAGLARQVAEETTASRLVYSPSSAAGSESTDATDWSLLAVPPAAARVAVVSSLSSVTLSSDGSERSIPEVPASTASTSARARSSRPLRDWD